ncbi:MAG: CPBP family glutamic-type intramembrane protease [Planctomycetota bacterium]
MSPRPDDEWEEDEEWEDEEDWEEEEDWDEDEEPVPSRPRSGPAVAERRRHLAGLALGYLAMLPLILVYEWGRTVQSGGSGTRNTAELLLFFAFEPFGPDLSTILRWLALTLGAVLALYLCYRRQLAPVPETLRIIAEGALGALLIGPILAFGMRLFEGTIVLMDRVEAAPLVAEVGAPPAGSRAALAFGAGAWEEILFRVLLYGLVFLFARRLFEYWGASKRTTWLGCEGAALVLSSLAFAAFHLAAFLPRGWTGGESFDSRVFLWRCSAGLVLALLFRWRGPGVAAWTHGLFNLALLLRVDPEVLL